MDRRSTRIAYYKKKEEETPEFTAGEENKSDTCSLL
jgi:hypothetical protein